jgi:hypothetical protein
MPAAGAASAAEEVRLCGIGRVVPGAFGHRVDQVRIAGTRPRRELFSPSVRDPLAAAAHEEAAWWLLPVSVEKKKGEIGDRCDAIFVAVGRSPYLSLSSLRTGRSSQGLPNVAHVHAVKPLQFLLFTISFVDFSFLANHSPNTAVLAVD